MTMKGNAINILNLADIAKARAVPDKEKLFLQTKYKDKIRSNLKGNIVSNT